MKRIKVAMKSGRPRSTHYKAVQKAIKNYQIDPETGHVYNAAGERIGGNTYEPRVTIHLEGKKYNARVNKLVGFVGFGPEALRKGVSVRHKNGDKYDNRLENLHLVYSPEAERAYRRLQSA